MDVKDKEIIQDSDEVKKKVEEVEIKQEAAEEELKIEITEDETPSVSHHHHCDKESHVHEFLGSSKLADKCYDKHYEKHNHRFCGITEEVIPMPCGGHKHLLCTKTDYFDHFHQIAAETGSAILVGDGKHVHFVKGLTSFEDGHVHQYMFATLIESPLTGL